jgi:hypothetical protein
MQKLIFARIKDVDMVQTREVDLVYYGMAEVSPLVKSFVTLYPMFKWYGSNMLKVYAWFVELLSGWTDSGKLLCWKDGRVMGSFDGWTYGEQMSPESTGMYTRFTSTVKLRPGRWDPRSTLKVFV